MKYDPIRIAKGVRPNESREGKQPGRRKSKHKRDSRSDGNSMRSQDPGYDELNINGSFQGTVIYVHGIANKPKASVLKCQWDQALFGTGMGQRTRMVYWVNRDRYPDPFPAVCSDQDFSEGGELGGGEQEEESLVDETRTMRLELAEQQARSLLKRSDVTERRKERIERSLKNLADSIESNAIRSSENCNGPHAEVLPLPRWARDRLTRTFTRLLLNDVFDYFFDDQKAAEIDKKFWRRLSGGGPFVVVGHSLGSVIAYRNLCQNDGELPPGSVKLFLTIGSPLGLQEVQDNLAKKLDVERLVVPDCITNWVNVSDRLDPVALDSKLDGDFAGPIRDLRVQNLDSPRHPHSATGYLGLSECQEPVRSVVGAAFAQPISSFSIARDLTDSIEDSLTLAGDETIPEHRREKHHVLIELNEGGGNNLNAARDCLLREIEAALGQTSFRAIKWIELRRYLAADLTSWQIERLGPILQRRQAGRIWNDAEKMTLATINHPREDPIQSAAAARVYGADGENINWAVLDTGVQPYHPHFQTYNNIAQMWDCTHSESEITPQNCQLDVIDKHGHGTHVGAIIAGVVMTASGDPRARNGVSPRTKLHSYKVLDSNGRGRDSYIIRALDHIASVNESASSLVIQGVNLSLGGPFDPETYGCGHSPICRELRRLWRQGVLVVVAAGNAGFAELQSTRGSLRANLDLSIGDPANLEEAISVGSVHLANPLTYGTSFFSSRGPTADGRQKPDLVAPGERIRSANYAYQYSDDYIELSGTSMAAPHVSGLLAAFLSQRKELIGEPDRVKEILLKNCTDLGRDPYVQGAGLPNLVRMLLAT